MKFVLAAVARAVSVSLLLALTLISRAPAMAQNEASSPPDLLALPVEKPIRGVSYPSLSPDGKTLCFTYLGDLWTVAAEGGIATRLTVHESQDALSRWSPD